MAKVKPKKTTVKAKIKKKIVSKKKKVVILPKNKIAGKIIGKVSHYFSNIGVGVIKLSGILSVGDEIRIVGGESTDFNQGVKSLQIDHLSVKKAKKGALVGLKIKEKVREGYKVYKV